MQTEWTTVLDQALALPTQQRLELVDALLSSLSGPIAPEIDRAWRDEAEPATIPFNSGPGISN